MPSTHANPATFSRRVFLASIPLGALALAVGCSPQQEANTTLTAEQAERFATMRFALHQQGAFRASVHVAAEVGMQAEVQVDLEAANGFGTFETDLGAEQSQTGLLAWNAEKLAVAGSGTLDEAETAEWFARPVETSVISDLFLLMLLSLGTDRPENPQLLQQSTARFQGTGEVDGVRCEIFSGPQEEGSSAASRTRYWVSEEGEMKRFEANLDTTQEEWSRADIGTADSAFVLPDVAAGLLTAGAI